MAKKRKSVLPKRIAGVKVPKSVRKGPLGQLLASRTGQALIAEAIMAAGAVGVAKQANDDSGDKTPSMTGGVVADALRRWQGAGRGHGHHHGHGKEIDPMGATVAFALGEAARAFVRVLNEHRSRADAPAPAQPAGEIEAEWRAKAEEPEGSKKARLLGRPALTPAPIAAAPPASPPRRDGATAKAAAFGTRNLVRFAQWRGRKAAERDLRRSRAATFHGFIQINLIRPG